MVEPTIAPFEIAAGDVITVVTAAGKPSRWRVIGVMPSAREALRLDLVPVQGGAGPRLPAEGAAVIDDPNWRK